MVVGLVPGLAQWVKDLAWLWLWRRPAAGAPIRPLAWKPPYATHAALKRQKNIYTFFLFILFYFSFLWQYLWHMEVSGPRVESELQLRPTQQPRQHRSGATSAN